MAEELLTLTDRGLYCPPGDFHVDPWKPVDRALLTHAHADHTRAGSRRYLDSAGLASGWMRIRGTRRRKALDQGFVLSDHADWAGLLQAIRATGAEQVLMTDGYVAVLGRYLQEASLDARALLVGDTLAVDSVPKPRQLDLFS